MSEFPEDKMLPFRATRELSIPEIRRLVLFAARLGLEPQFDGGPAILPRHKILEHYAKATYPTTPQSYLGREHFRVIGDQLGLARRRISMFFTHLCYPLDNKGNAIDPLNVGLKVGSRKEAGMPKVEVVNLNNSFSTDRQKKHEAHFRDLPTEHDTVIQARGIIEVSRNQVRAAELGILSTYETFREFGAGLAEIVANPSLDLGP